jgi:hypothetical protein
MTRQITAALQVPKHEHEHEQLMSGWLQYRPGAHRQETFDRDV